MAIVVPELALKVQKKMLKREKKKRNRDMAKSPT